MPGHAVRAAHPVLHRSWSRRASCRLFSRSAQPALACCHAMPSRGRRSAGLTRVRAQPAGWWSAYLPCMPECKTHRPCNANQMLLGGLSTPVPHAFPLSQCITLSSYPGTPCRRELHVLPHRQCVGGGAQHHPPVPLRLPGVQVGARRWRGRAGHCPLRGAGKHKRVSSTQTCMPSRLGIQPCCAHLYFPAPKSSFCRSRLPLRPCLFHCRSLDSMTLDEGSSPFLTEVTLDLAAGSATTRRLPGAVPGDFPVVPPSLVGELAGAGAA